MASPGYVYNTDMKRKVVRTGSSLAITLPREVVDEFKLEAGDEVDVSVHPQTGAIVVRPGVKYFEDGKVTRRFRAASERVLEKYDKAFEALAK
jgi:antitoxin MazE